MLLQKSSSKRSIKWEDALMTFILHKVSNSTEIQCLTNFCSDFSAEYPDHAGKRGTINSRIRTILRNIDHEKFDDTTLARMMFCLAQPLDGKLETVRERLHMSGTLRVDEYFRITFYENGYVQLQGTQRHKNRPDVQRDIREGRKRRSSPSLEEQYELQMELEAWEMGEREKIKEEVERRAMGIVDPEIKFEYEEDNSNIPSGSSSAVPSLRFSQELKFEGIGAKRMRHVEELDDDRSDLEGFFDYGPFLRSIHNYTLVLQSHCFEILRSEIVEELEKPETYGMTIPENRITEAMDYGIKIVTKSVRPDLEKASNPFGLHEFLRSMKLQLLNIGFSMDSEIVTKITNVIDETAPEMMVPMNKIKFALENIFEKIRQ